MRLNPKDFEKFTLRAGNVAVSKMLAWHAQRSLTPQKLGVWYIPLILALRRRKQKDQKLKLIPC